MPLERHAARVCILHLTFNIAKYQIPRICLLPDRISRKGCIIELDDAAMEPAELVMDSRFLICYT